jgi:hypothetical protein
MIRRHPRHKSLFGREESCHNRASTPARRLAANRANAAGPPGKLRSFRNAVKHGFTGSHFGVVRLEEFADVANLKTDAVACYQPVNSRELLAVERIAVAQQQIPRGARFESGLFTSALDATISTCAFTQRHPAPGPGRRL